MKTPTRLATKAMILPLFMLFTTGAIAQETSKGSGEVKKMKVCIKIDENKNGVVQQVDTCFESTSHDEIKAFLESMGVNHTMQMGEGTHSETKTIVIHHDDDMDKSSKKHRKHKKSDKDGEPHEIIIQMDENGNVISNDENAKIIIKHGELSEESIQKELDSIIKIHHPNGGSDQLIKKEIRVYVSKKVMVNSLTEEDKKALPQNLQKIDGKSFDNLEIYPNPAVDKVNVKFKSDGNDIKVKLYDAQGQVLLTDEYKNPERDFNKEIDLSVLPKGIYFLHIEQGKKSEVKKLVVSE